MKALFSIVIWFVIVGLFSAFGYFGDGQSYSDWTGNSDSMSESEKIEIAWEGTLSWGGLGVGIATCIASAWLLLLKIRSGNLARGWAMLIFAVVCAGSILLPAIVMMTASGFISKEIFRGESGLIIYAMCYWMFWVAIITLALFIPLTFVVKRIEPVEL